MNNSIMSTSYMFRPKSPIPV